MVRRLIALAVATLPMLAAAFTQEMPSRMLEAAAPAPTLFRAPQLGTVSIAALAPLAQKDMQDANVPGKPMRIGTVRDLAKSARIEQWTPVDGGYAIRLSASSEGALGLRVKLELGALPGPIEARVQGSNARIEPMTLDAALGAEAWTPWTEGDTQVIELFSRVRPEADAVSVASVVHFTDSPLTAKALAASCTVPAVCTTNDPSLDAAIAERGKSVAKISFVDAGTAYLCTATLINTPKYPSPFLLTANHCIDNANAAASLATFWFYANSDCAATDIPNFVQVAGGSQLVFTNYNVDSTLLLMNRAPPSGVVYAGWDATLVPLSTPIVSLSHPQGDTLRQALGSVTVQYIRIAGRPQDEYGISLTTGIIQGGSSGSGLFTNSGGSLKLRGILTGSTVNQPGGLSCTDLNEYVLYSRFEIFEPEIDQYIGTARAPDDAPNRAQDLFNAPITDPTGVDMPLNQRTTTLALAKSIDYAGDLDVFRFTLTAPSTVTVWSEGSMDTVGSILDSQGANVEANDDGSGNAAGDYNFRITRALAAGTYYVQVGPWNPAVTGPYTLKMSAAAATPPNYTDLWWNPTESGWGVNVNHQGDILFATLFDYDAAGPMWLVMSNGAKQPDGSYYGPLYRTTGPAFNASPWGSTATTLAGTMRLAFSSPTSGTLTYIANGVTVTKSISRQVFSTPPTCTFTTSDRSAATNYQDLWWNPAESGWGVNIAHQGDVLFATLFTYDASGKGMWLVMSNGNRIGTGTYSGTLYLTAGPAFNTSPWPGATSTPVGTMTFAFSSGNAGTLTYSVNGVTVTKSIQRQVFSSPTTQCQ